MRNIILSICLVVFSSGLLLAQLSKTEKKIVRSVDQNNEHYTSLLKEIVNINSGTMNFEGVKHVGMVLKKEFETLGMETKWVDGAAFGRAGHLVAVNKGQKGPKMLLIGHLDTVFEPDSPFQQYTMLNDSIMKGPGVADMKGGDVIILLALKALKEANILDQMQVEVVLTGDEEKSGSPLELSKKNLVEGAKRADIALAFENADGDPKTIVVSRRSSSGWTLTVSGNAAHSSQVFTDKVGVGAIYEASRILREFYEQLSREENLTFNPGVILGGTSTSYDAGQSGGTALGKSNVVAKEVVVTGDIRAVSLEQLEKAKRIMQEIAANNYPGTSAEIIFNEDGYPPLAPSDGNRKLLSYYDKVSKDLGYGPVEAVNPRNAGAADVSFTSGYVDMAIDGMGLSGADDHTINETGNLNMLSIQAKRAAVLMYRLVSARVKE
ncbi:Acetylornithine deacetylase/Succinyl-diaminopimelate desuccinylase [Fulvivirga imtechensis AK7]|uniref:Acetylornithine deacetylase/Succinyl-diaminopimelate desuccinylase n=1 Tax=Fulvivirga imtechensis AK7 TaxID=1237149 RepID=L8JT70_9BACT|nr:M20/M25/M40 family metallo-hydrolase [Fulvivirga imtechensis]ELR70684.1 Acetylornithine deacetylase/Succinyl-diaminopimelate desuccinylase [Fulvivirga imtechensis AK7]